MEGDTPVCRLCKATVEETVEHVFCHCSSIIIVRFFMFRDFILSWDELRQVHFTVFLELGRKVLQALQKAYANIPTTKSS
ncbi:hypothetical protein Trydic_g10780 [Trypoxylus dichotomus]